MRFIRKIITGTPPAPHQAATPFSIDRAEIRGGTLRCPDHGSADSFAPTGLVPDATLPDVQGKADIRASAMINGQAATRAGTVNGFDGFLDGNVMPVTLSDRLAGAKVSFVGRFGPSPVPGERKTDPPLGEVPAVLVLLGRAAPGLPAGPGRGRIAVSGMAKLPPRDRSICARV